MISNLECPTQSLLYSPIIAVGAAVLTFDSGEMLLKPTMYNQREGRAIVCLAVIICLFFLFCFVQPVEDTAPVKATWGWRTYEFSCP